MKIAIAAAAGNIGSRTARRVAAAGAQTILLGRDTDKLERLHINNAISIATDLSETNAVIKATAGSDALLWLVPPTPDAPSYREWYEKITAAGIEAVKTNGIKRIVAVSGIGAGNRENLGTISYVGRMEESFWQLEINFVALRPGYFMENFLMQTDSIKTDGSFAFTFRARPRHSVHQHGRHRRCRRRISARRFVGGALEPQLDGTAQYHSNGSG